MVTIFPHLNLRYWLTLVDPLLVLILNDFNEIDRYLLSHKAVFSNLKDIKVVILGQDPYHNFNQANGLCFSVNNNEKLPPSLKNIFKISS